MPAPTGADRAADWAGAGADAGGGAAAFGAAADSDVRPRSAVEAGDDDAQALLSNSALNTRTATIRPAMLSPSHLRQRERCLSRP